MVSRFLILSGIPMDQLRVCNEIQNMVSFLVKNIQSSKSNIISGGELKKLFAVKDNFRIFIFDVFLVQVSTSGFGSSNLPEWDIFEFFTKKVGRRGPSKAEYLEYYNQKLIFHVNYFK